ncbi:type VI secretion system baseplate subunit TssF [Falsirhodobacter sp. 20TX0035]|uniref:type VI secretion system baseplate subunit TssF n=1 Tax=Falsirhodobacter sp. 20TX0035 TaxID=3022019 RepID=UPI00232FF4B2|nr:type VI secretion system baseplate subunit TssF [Falsirhodobacter sp. 20TX0035]MDB6453061.1 type VI secretion system baseplate subunit TssF [Falsirhodobacter sp. 20TX0035]
MTPDLLRLYNEELAYLREMGDEFATAYPKVAGRLGLEAGEASDPHVERLLEGVAFLSARVQAKLRARFPDFTQALLDIVYPHFTSPIPSMTIAGFTPDAEAGRMEKGHLIPRGTRLVTGVVPGTITACEFRTAQDVHLWPIEVRSLDYIHTPDRISSLHLGGRGAQAVIRLRLGTTNGMALQKLALRTLALHFPSDGGTGGALLQQLLSDCTGVVLRPLDRPCPWQERLPPSALRHAFDAPEQALLPPVPRSFSGYRLLQEYFALPDRVLFAELTGLADAIAASDTAEIEILFPLRRSHPQLERQLRRENVRLFATPAVNLFEKTADRIRVDGTRHEFHIVPDRVRPLDMELHSVLGVQGELASGERMPFRALYALHDARDGEVAGYYTLRRETRVLSQRVRQYGTRTSYVGTEGFLTITDPAAPPFRADLQQLSVRCLCSNRDLPLMLPCGEGATDFSLDIAAPVTAIRCLTLPTRPGPAPAEGDVAWKLISHLSLNYLSITDAEEGATALRELLSLYAPADRPELAHQIAGVERVSAAPAIRRIPGAGLSAVARGVEVTLHLDEAAFAGIGSFPLSSVLARFFARHASINSFAETVLHSGQDGEVARWPAIPGRVTVL